jgi:hypothetical protein
MQAITQVKLHKSNEGCIRELRFKINLEIKIKWKIEIKNHNLRYKLHMLLILNKLVTSKF